MIRHKNNTANASIVNAPVQSDHLTGAKGIHTEVAITDVNSVSFSKNFEVADDNSLILRNPLVLSKNTKFDNHNAFYFHIFDKSGFTVVPDIQVFYKDHDTLCFKVVDIYTNEEHFVDTERLLASGSPSFDLTNLKYCNAGDSTILTGVEVNLYDLQERIKNLLDLEALNLYNPHVLYDFYENYAPELSYVVNDVCIHNQKTYKCIADTTGSWDSSKWSLLDTRNAFKVLRYLSIYKDEEHGWIVELINPEVNTFVGGDSATEFNPNLTLDNPLAIKDLYNYGGFSVANVLAYLKRYSHANEYSLVEQISFTKNPLSSSDLITNDIFNLEIKEELENFNVVATITTKHSFSFTNPIQNQSGIFTTNPTLNISIRLSDINGIIHYINKSIKLSDYVAKGTLLCKIDLSEYVRYEQVGTIYPAYRTFEILEATIYTSERLFLYSDSVSHTEYSKSSFKETNNAAYDLGKFAVRVYGERVSTGSQITGISIIEQTRSISSEQKFYTLHYLKQYGIDSEYDNGTLYFVKDFNYTGVQYYLYYNERYYTIDSSLRVPINSDDFTLSIMVLQQSDTNVAYDPSVAEMTEAVSNVRYDIVSKINNNELKEIQLKAFLTTRVDNTKYYALWEMSKDDGISWESCPAFESKFYNKLVRIPIPKNREEVNESLTEAGSYTKYINVVPMEQYKDSDPISSRPDILNILNNETSYKYRFSIYRYEKDPEKLYSTLRYSINNTQTTPCFRLKNGIFITSTECLFNYSKNTIYITIPEEEYSQATDLLYKTSYRFNETLDDLDFSSVPSGSILNVYHSAEKHLYSIAIDLSLLIDTEKPHLEELLFKYANTYLRLYYSVLTNASIEEGSTYENVAVSGNPSVIVNTEELYLKATADTKTMVPYLYDGVYHDPTHSTEGYSGVLVTNTRALYNCNFVASYPGTNTAPTSQPPRQNSASGDISIKSISSTESFRMRLMITLATQHALGLDTHPEEGLIGNDYPILKITHAFYPYQYAVASVGDYNGHCSPVDYATNDVVSKLDYLYGFKGHFIPERVWISASFYNYLLDSKQDIVAKLTHWDSDVNKWVGEVSENVGKPHSVEYQGVTQYYFDYYRPTNTDKIYKIDIELKTSYDLGTSSQTSTIDKNILEDSTPLNSIYVTSPKVGSVVDPIKLSYKVKGMIYNNYDFDMFVSPGSVIPAQGIDLSSLNSTFYLNNEFEIRVRLKNITSVFTMALENNVLFVKASNVNVISIEKHSSIEFEVTSSFEVVTYTHGSSQLPYYVTVSEILSKIFPTVKLNTNTLQVDLLNYRIAKDLGVEYIVGLKYPITLVHPEFAFTDAYYTNLDNMSREYSFRTANIESVIDRPATYKGYLVSEKEYVFDITNLKTELVKADTVNSIAGEHMFYNNQIITYNIPGKDSKVYVSNVGSYITPMYNTIDLTYSSKVSKIMAWRNYIIIFTPTEIYLAIPNEDGTYSSKLLNNTIGLPLEDANTATILLNSIIFKSGTRIYKLAPNLYSATDTVLNLHCISTPIDSLLSIGTKNFAVSNNEKYFVFIPKENSTDCFVYNLETKTWSYSEYYAVLKGYSYITPTDIRVYDDAHEYLFNQDFKELLTSKYFDKLEYGDYMSDTVDQLKEYIDSIEQGALVSSIPAKTDIIFQIDFGQKSSNYTLDKQFMETKMLFGSCSDKDTFPVTIAIYTDGIKRNIHDNDIHTDGALIRQTFEDFGTLSTDFIYDTTSINTGVIRQLFVKYSGRGKTIRHVVSGSSKSKFKFYSMDIRYRISIKKQ